MYVVIVSHGRSWLTHNEPKLKLNHNQWNCRRTKNNNKIVLLKQLFHYMFEVIAVSYLSFRKVSSEFLF